MNNTLELDLDNIPGSVNELVGCKQALEQDRAALSKILDTFATNTSALSYPEIEEYRGQVEVALEECEMFIEALDRAIQIKILTR